MELAQLLIGRGQGEPSVEIDLQRLRRDVVRRHVRVDACVDAYRARDEPLAAGELLDSFVQQVNVELEADGGHVAGLLPAEQLAGAPISRSRIAIANPEPSSVWSASVERRARASSVSSVASG